MDLKNLELKLARSENLPVLPQVVSAVLKLADDPDASPRAMEKVVERDPAITAKILRVANSSYYGGAQINSIGRAISMLGLNSVKSLVVGVAYQQVIAGKGLAQKFDKLAFWRHSLATATASRIIGKLRMPLRSEELFTAGMMHDIGHLAMDKFCPAELDIAITASLKYERPMHETEREIMGFDHAELGSILAERWGFTGALKSAIRFHHAPHLDRDTASLAAVIAAANAVAYSGGYGNQGCSQANEIDTALLERIGLPIEQFVAISGVMTTEVQRAEDAYQIH